MSLKHKCWNGLFSLGLMLGTATGTAVAQPPETTAESNQFRRVELPLPLKVGVTLGGVTLIGLELWWFQFSKTKAQKAQLHLGFQEIDITVDGGYEPSRIVLQAGQPVRLNFLRKDPSSCLQTVLLPDFHKSVDLPLNRTTALEFTPQEPGTYPFNCGMNMFRGTLDVQGEGQTLNSQHSQTNSGSKAHVAVAEPSANIEMAQLHQGFQETDITIEKGYKPNRVIVNAGIPVRLKFLRKDANPCLKQVILPDFDLAVDLSLDQITPVEFTPQHPGEYRFTCGMGMFQGVVEVKAPRSKGCC